MIRFIICAARLVSACRSFPFLNALAISVS
jgi:hypothetical protein